MRTSPSCASSTVFTMHDSPRPLCCSACTSLVPHAAFTDSSWAAPSLKTGVNIPVSLSDREKKRGGKGVRGKVRYESMTESGSDAGGYRKVT